MDLKRRCNRAKILKMTEREKQLDFLAKQAQELGLYDGNFSMTDSWDEIFAEIEDSLHAELPIRVKNWLRNKFHTPVKKQDNV